MGEPILSVGLDFDVARKRATDRCEWRNDDRRWPESEEGIRGANDRGSNESGLRSDGRTEVDVDDVTEVHDLSGQLGVEPGVPLVLEVVPRIGVGAQLPFGVGHRSVELVAPECLQSGIERLGHG